MIRKQNIFYLFLLIPVFILSCTGEEPEYEPPETVTEIVPTESEDENYRDIYNGSAFNVNSEKPVIEIGIDEVLINTLNLNLDLDSHEEQIIVLKHRNDPDGRIYITVADYSNVTSTYIRVWQSETLAENIRSFMVYLDDLIGDHNSEIVCSGRDAGGNTTLNVFWKNTSDNNLSYIPVFEKTVKGTIDINQMERVRGYHQGLKDGVSYTITMTSEAAAEDGTMNLVKTVYYWDFPLRQYIELSSEIIENNDIAETRLSYILNGDESVFYDFISGPWFKDQQIIYFDPENESSTFYTDDIQENYDWMNSYKIMSNLLYTRCKNEIINYIENEIYVRVIDVDEVKITVRDIDNQTRKKNENEIWTGTYVRMNNDMKADTVKTLESVIDVTELPVLTGQYISDAGDLMEFYGSDFYMKNAYEEISGGFAVYSADFNILNLKVIDDNGMVSEERSFAIDYREDRKENSIERTIVLTPGTLSIYGFHVSDTEFFRFTQIETLEIMNEDAQ